jgi:1,4-alpha-glucan branching enzyme
MAVLNAMGGYQALKRFVKAANTKGIAVLLDIVWNHMDGGSNILYQYDGTGNNGIYFYENAPYASTPWGPRPNYDSSPVYQYILDSIQMWLTEYHISGFRWDSTVCIRLAGDPCYYGTTNIVNGWKVMQDGNNLSHKTSGWTTAEDTKDYKDITKATSDTTAGIPGAPGGAGFDDQWEETWYYTLEPGLVLANNGQLDANSISKMIGLQDNEDPNRVMYTENHDKASNQQQGRIPKVVDPSGSPTNPSFWALKKSLMGIGLELTNSGVPMLFYGQEFLTYDPFNFPVPPNLNWNLVNNNQGVIYYVTDLAALKLNKAGKTAGLTGDSTKIMQVVNDGTNKVIAFDRYSGSSHTVVVANMYQTNYTSFIVTNFPADGVWQIRFNGDNKRYSSQFGSFGLNQTSVTVSGGNGTVMLPQYSILVLSQ